MTIPRSSLWSVLWHWWHHDPAETASEALLRRALEDRDTEIRNLRLDLDAVRSSLRIAELEVHKLTEVIERDRKRVAAETAIAAQTIARATSDRG